MYIKHFLIVSFNKEDNNIIDISITYSETFIYKSHRLFGDDISDINKASEETTSCLDSRGTNSWENVPTSFDGTTVVSLNDGGTFSCEIKKVLLLNFTNLRPLSIFS